MSDAFIQFKLCALAYNADESERYHAIISYGLIEAGKEMYWKLPADDQDAKRARIEECPPKGYDRRNLVHLFAVIGAEALGISLGSVNLTQERHEALYNFVHVYEQKHGTDCIVRIKRSLIFQVRDEGALNVREFGVLCGVYSIIGAKPYACIRRDLVKARALGYKNASVMKAECRFRKDKQKPLTDWQVRATLDKLHSLRFFSRARGSLKSTYYSNKLDDVELRETLLRKLTYEPVFKREQADKDRKLMAAIAAKSHQNHHETTTIISGPLAPPQTAA